MIDRKHVAIIGAKGAAIFVVAATWYVLPSIIPGPAVAELLRIQALAITFAAFLNLGAAPFVAQAFAIRTPEAPSVLASWLRRRVMVGSLLLPMVWYFLGDSTMVYPIKAIPAALITIWALAYSYDLTDIALVSCGEGMAAAAVAFATSLGGLILKISLATAGCSLLTLAISFVVEAVARVAIQWRLVEHFSDSRNERPYKPVPVRQDAPVMFSSIINAASLRGDQLAASTLLSTQQGAIYFLASRFIDAAWFVPFTLISLLYSSAGRTNSDADLTRPTPRKKGLQTLLCIAFCVVSLVIVAAIYQNARSTYKHLVPTMAISSLSLVFFSLNAIAWREEAAAGDKETGFKRTATQAVFVALAIATLFVTKAQSAISIASFMILARFIALAINGYRLPRFREALTTFSSS